MNWWIHLSAFLLGLAAGIMIGVWLDRDVIYKISGIKIKGRGHQVDHLLSLDEDWPDRISRRKAKKLKRLEKKLKE